MATICKDHVCVYVCMYTYTHIYGKFENLKITL